jgi:flagellar hook-associated protein FlgK
MMNMSTALTALRTSQTGLKVVGNNIANANTPGYHRQELRLVDRMPVEIDNLYIGQGVEISHIHRAYDLATENALTRNIGEQAAVKAELQTSRQIEALVIPGQGTILDRLEGLFNDLERLTAAPDNAATRSIVLGSAQSLTESINNMSRALEDITAQIDQTILAKLAFIEAKTGEISDLNVKIFEAEIRKQSPNDLMDRRDALINDLAEVIDVEVASQLLEGPNNNIAETVLRLAEGQLGVARQPLKLRTTVDDSGTRLIIKDGQNVPIEVNYGELGGLLRARNEVVGEYRARLESFTQGLISTFDTIHANGVGVSGSFSVLAGKRHIEEVDVPLAEVATVVPVQAGSLFLSIIDPAGRRSVHEITIDPAVDSLEDVAAKISALDHLEARVDDPPGQLSFRAEAGYQFDFLTSQPTLLDTASISGSVQPTVIGQFEGDTNDEYTFEFESTGTIGVTPDLMLTVRDRDGALVGNFNVGQGYSADSNLNLGQGIQLRLSPGDVNASDSFTLSLIRQSDMTNILAATGTNSLFEGGGAATIAVRRDLLSNPEQFAVTLSGNPLDSRNAEAMLDVRYSEFMTNGTETLEENFQAFVGSIGARVLDLTQTQQTLTVIEDTVRANLDSISGVDPNEEAVKMLQYQRSFQAAARLITTLDETMQELMNIIR